MASLSTDANNNRSLQFVASDGKRRTMRLGKVAKRVAEEIKLRIEHLAAAQRSGLAVDGETATWLGKIGDDLADKLAAVGLIAPRAKQEAARLGGFIEPHITNRTDLKDSSRRAMETVRLRLLEFFGAERTLQSITPGDADALVVWLRTNYAGATASRSIKSCKTFFRAAVRSKLIAENPFTDIKPGEQSNPARSFFVTLEMAAKVFDAAPDWQWRLLFALSRYGGLRCPSEHFGLKLADIDWERQRFLVRSPKTEHHEGHAERWVPLFPALRPYLEDAFECALPGAEYLFDDRYRDTRKNLRTRLTKIIRRAGLSPWPRLWHNLRASRQTELPCPRGQRLARQLGADRLEALPASDR